MLGVRVPTVTLTRIHYLECTPLKCVEIFVSTHETESCICLNSNLVLKYFYSVFMS